MPRTEQVLDHHISKILDAGTASTGGPSGSNRRVRVTNSDQRTSRRASSARPLPVSSKNLRPGPPSPACQVASTRSSPSSRESNGYSVRPSPRPALPLPGAGNRVAVGRTIASTPRTHSSSTPRNQSRARSLSLGHRHGYIVYRTSQAVKLVWNRSGTASTATPHGADR